MSDECGMAYIVSWNCTTNSEKGSRTCFALRDVDTFLCELERLYGMTGYRYGVHPVMLAQFV